MISQFATVIEYQFDEDKEKQFFILDTTNSINTNSTITTTTQPLVNGDEITDHYFRQPDTLSINGTFSMNSSTNVNIQNKSNLLSNFQRTFNKIKDNGIICNIYKMALTNKNEVRFDIHKNMILKACGWTENINSLDFSFSFTEVLLVDVITETLDLSEEEYIPSITFPKRLSFSDSNLFNWDIINASIIQTLRNEGLMSEEFLNYAKNTTIAGATVALAGVAIIAAMSIAGTNPVGWVILAAGAIVAGVAIFVKGIYDAIKGTIDSKKYMIEKFELVKNNDKKNKLELERFSDFMNDIYSEFKVLDDVISVFQISENIPQVDTLSIADDYYLFDFKQNNINNKYSLEIKNAKNDILGSIADITGSPTSFFELTASNYVIKTKNNSRVYLICPEDDEEKRKDLKNYYILVSDIFPEKFNEIVNEIIKSYLIRDYKKK